MFVPVLHGNARLQLLAEAAEPGVSRAVKNIEQQQNDRGYKRREPVSAGKEPCERPAAGGQQRVRKGDEDFQSQQAQEEV